MESLLLGLTLLVTTPLLFAAVGGVSWGVLGGALPGISPSITMALYQGERVSAHLATIAVAGAASFWLLFVRLLGIPMPALWGA